MGLDIGSDKRFVLAAPQTVVTVQSPSGLPESLQHEAGCTRIRVKINEWNRRSLRGRERPELDPEAERELRERYREEVERLESILGRDLTAWK